MAVHPGAAAVEQDRPAGAGSDGLVDGAADCGRQRDEDDLGAFAADAQHPMAMLFTQIVDVRPSGLEDAQAEQPGHRDQREVTGVRRLAGRSKKCLKLQVREPESW